MSLEFTGHPGVVFCVAWHPDGQRIASAGWDDERKQFVVKVWDARTGRPGFALAGRRRDASPWRSAPTAAIWSRGERIEPCRSGTRRPATRSARSAPTTGDPGAGLQPRRPAPGLGDGDGTVKLWDATRWGRSKRLATSSPWAARVAMNLAFSPDGRRLVAGGAENTVKIWDVQTGRELHTLRGHTETSGRRRSAPTPVAGGSPRRVRTAP